MWWPTVRRAGAALLDALTDLALGTRCAGCDGPARLLCPTCDEELVGASPLARVLPDGVEIIAAAPYTGVVQGVVVEHKERGRLGLAAPLGRMLLTAVAQALPPGTDRPVVLVPAPSTARAVRRRGHDPVARMSRRAARAMRAAGRPVVVVPLLRHRRRVQDQAGLDAAARRTNLSGALSVRRRGAARLRRMASAAGAADAVDVVVVDDILTTGATMQECVDTLRAAHISVASTAVLAVVGEEPATIR